MPDFQQTDLHESRFQRVDLRGTDFHTVDLSGARFRMVDLTGAVLRDVELVDVTIDGELANVRVNGVDIVPLIEAELDRRDPERVLMRPTDAAGFRAAWDVVERRWAETVDRARQLDPGLLHESVDDEWSFIETLRHLVFVTDSWVTRAVHGVARPWHPLSLPWDQMPDTPGVPRDRDARPSLDAVLELRRDRMATVRRLVEGLTEETLRGSTQPVAAPGWPEPVSHRVRDCLSIVLNEEWEHRRFAERDLAFLVARRS